MNDRIDQCHEVILRNAARCLGCGKLVVSTYRHHAAGHNCLSEGKVYDFMVDGGKDYLRRGWNSGSTGRPASDVFEDASIIAHAPMAAMGKPTRPWAWEMYK
jgi:hypothetical protein